MIEFTCGACKVICDQIRNVACAPWLHCSCVGLTEVQFEIFHKDNFLHWIHRHC